MSNHIAIAVGVDISKSHLDVHELPSERSARLANDADGIEAMAAWVGPTASLGIHQHGLTASQSVRIFSATSSEPEHALCDDIFLNFVGATVD